MNTDARTLLLLAPLALALAACSEDSDYDFDAAAEARVANLAENPPAGVVFDPAAGAEGLPFPIDLVFAGSEDGTINIAVESEEDGVSAEQAAMDLSNPIVALNLMDGFSTTAPISTSVTGELDPASLRVGETIRVFELATTGEGPAATVSGLGAELDDTEIAVVERDDTLLILPLRPLSPATQHVVYVTTGVTGADGEPIAVPSAFTFARAATPLAGSDDAERDAAIAEFNPGLPALEPLRQYIRPLVELAGTAETAPLAPTDIALTWSFRTQGIREVLQAAEDLVTPKTLIVGNSGQTTSAVPGGRGLADIYVGALDLPYYQVPVFFPSDGSEVSLPDRLAAYGAAVNGFWISADTDNVVTRFDPVPRNRGDVKVPVLMTVPNATSGTTMPEGGWPVMIFQHGITQDRTNALAVADAMAAAGFVVVAIDLPVHGIVDPDSPFLASEAGRNPFVNGERTFGIDLLTIGESGDIVPAADGSLVNPDGVTDPSGQHFYSPANLVNSRDNLRQAAADLMTLSASLEGMLVAGADGTPAPFPLDTTRKAFLGHSLGGIVGTTFLSYDDSVTSATLAMPGGGIAQLLANSAAFGPTLLRGVTAANGGELSAADYQQFLATVQTVIDSGDPINHAATLAAANTSALHLMEVVGEDGVSLPDQVIPNAVAGAPLAGTEPLARELGLTAVVESAGAGSLVRFSRGNHGSILNPVAPGGTDEDGNPVEPSAEEQATALAVTTEMQTQSATFAASGGTMLPIGNADVIAPLDVEITEATLPVLEAPLVEPPAAGGARP